MNFILSLFCFHSLRSFEIQQAFSASEEENDLPELYTGVYRLKFIYIQQGYQNFRFDLLGQNLTFLPYGRCRGV